MEDQAEMVQVDEMVQVTTTTTTVTVEETYVAVEENANGHHVVEGMEQDQEQAVEEEAPVIDHEGISLLDFSICMLDMVLVPVN